MDITQLILDDHHEQRRLFAIIGQIDRRHAEALAAVWARLSTLLEVHAEAEERHFYPMLLNVGAGAGGKPDADAETEDAIKDHNEIRDAIAKVGWHQVGSDAWFAAVANVDKANGDHMAEEEREGLPDLRDNADLQVRHNLAIAFVTFEALYFQGVRPVDKDPKAFVEANKTDRTSGR